jgi:hypothetical protein
LKRATKKQQIPTFITKARKASRKRSSAMRHGQQSDVGNVALHNHHRIVEEVRDMSSTGHVIAKGARVMDQLPIDRYHDRHELAPRPDHVKNAALYQAARKLLADFHASGLLESGKTSFIRMPGGGAGADKAMTLHVESLKAYNKAMLAVGPSLRSILHYVVCEGQTAGGWARSSHENAEGAMALLRAALTDLAWHYRLLSSKRTSPRPRSR